MIRCACLSAVSLSNFWCYKFAISRAAASSLAVDRVQAIRALLEKSGNSKMPLPKRSVKYPNWSRSTRWLCISSTCATNRKEQLRNEARELERNLALIKHELKEVTLTLRHFKSTASTRSLNPIDAASLGKRGWASQKGRTEYRRTKTQAGRGAEPAHQRAH